MKCFKASELCRGHSLACQFGRDALKFCQQLPNGQQLLKAHFGDNHPPPRQTGDQALCLKFDQGLTDRRVRKIVLKGNRVFVYGVAWQEDPIFNVLLNERVNFFAGFDESRFNGAHKVV